MAAVPGGGLPKPEPKDQPYEIDYLWRRAKLSGTPSRTHYRDLPIFSANDFDDVGTVKAALASLAQGQFSAAAQMCDAMIGDDRIGALLETRIDTLASLPIEISPSTKTGKKLKAQKIADQVEAEWHTWFADAEVKRLHEWGLNLGFSIGELLWDTSDPGRWVPRLKTWDLRYCYWRWDTRSFWMITLDGLVEVRPGDGHWVIYAPHGYSRPWMRGLVRAFALPFMTRRWSQRDWARWSEVHGLPIRVGYVPSQQAAAAQEDFIRELLYIGNESVIRADRDGGEGTGYDVKLVEAASQSWEGFRQLIAQCDENLAIRVLGQNLTTKAGGSGATFGAADIHDRIRMDRVESDAHGIGQCLTEQAVLPWCVYNFGEEGRGLLPSCSWSTKGLEDRAAAAKTHGAVGDALAKLRAGGLNVDREAYAKYFRIPLVDGEPLIEPKPPAPVPAGLGAHEPEEDAETDDGVTPPKDEPAEQDPAPDDGGESDDDAEES